MACCKELLARAALRTGKPRRRFWAAISMHCLPHGRRDADDVLESEMASLPIMLLTAKAGQLLNLRHTPGIGALHRQEILSCLPSPRSKEMVKLDREVLISSAVTAHIPAPPESQLRLAQPERGPAAELWPGY